MGALEQNLRRFERRVRWALGWKWAAIGLAVGASLAAMMALADLMRWLLVDPLMLGVPPLGLGVLGLLYGLRCRIPAKALADSIDRRGGLDDRISSAVAPVDSGSLLDAQRADAEEHLATIDPRRLYRLGLNRWHGAAAAAAVLAIGFYLAGNTGLFLSGPARSEREALQEKGRTVVENVQPVLAQQPKGAAAREAQALARRMERFGQELSRAKMSKEEALLKGNALMKEADDMMKQHAESAMQNMETAQQKLERAALEEARQKLGATSAELDKLPPSLRPESAESKALEEALAQAEQEISKLEKQLAAGVDGKGEALSAAEREALEKQLEGAKAMAEQLKLSKEAQETLKKLQQMKEFKELEKMMEQMRQKMQEARNGDPQQAPTKEELEALKKQIEELARQLKDEEAMREYLEALKEALKNAEACGTCSGLSLGLAEALGLSATGEGGRSRDLNFPNSGELPMLDKPETLDAKQDFRAVRGQRREAGEESYIEIRGPSGLGSKSSTPYMKVLPKYRRRAEEAIDRKRIPTKHQDRVRAYFDALQGGKP